MKFSYMTTSRRLDPKTGRPYADRDKTTAHADGGISFFKAQGAYNTDTSAYKLGDSSPAPGALLPADFKTDLLADLKAADKPILTLFIHGLGNPWDDALGAMAAYGQALQDGRTASKSPDPPVGYTNRGVTIGFSWPSFDVEESVLHYCAYHWDSPPTRQPTPNIRANIIDSTTALSGLLAALTGLKDEVDGFSLNVICHSEGNFMLMQTGETLSAPSDGSIAIDNIILLAADISRVALQSRDRSSAFDPQHGLYKGPGSAQALTEIGRRTWVFFSRHDSILWDSNEGYEQCHNPDGIERLGFAGPTYDSSLLAGVYGVDCSSVVNGGTSDLDFETPLYKDGKAHWIPEHLPDSILPIEAHSSYRYVPQILWATSQILNGAQASALYKITFSARNAQQGTMDWEKPPKSA